jgi:hypothetical protein
VQILKHYQAAFFRAMEDLKAGEEAKKAVEESRNAIVASRDEKAMLLRAATQTLADAATFQSKKKKHRLLRQRRREDDDDLKTRVNTCSDDEDENEDE